MCTVHDDVSFKLLFISYCTNLYVRMVLYMIYYPAHLKYASVDVDLHDNRPPHHVKTAVKSDEWRLSIILSWIVLLYT